MTHLLRISQAESGVWLTSNGRTWFLSLEMLADLKLGIEIFYEKREYQNYEDPVPAPRITVPSSAPKAGLADLMAIIAKES